MQGLTYTWEGVEDLSGPHATPMPRGTYVILEFDGVTLWEGSVCGLMREWCRCFTLATLVRLEGGLSRPHVAFLKTGVVNDAIRMLVQDGPADMGLLEHTLRPCAWSHLEVPDDLLLQHKQTIDEDIVQALVGCVALSPNPEAKRNEWLENLKWRLLTRAASHLQGTDRGDEFLVRALLSSVVHNKQRRV